MHEVVEAGLEPRKAGPGPERVSAPSLSLPGSGAKPRLGRSAATCQLPSGVRWAFQTTAATPHCISPPSPRSLPLTHPTPTWVSPPQEPALLPSRCPSPD